MGVGMRREKSGSRAHSAPAGPRDGTTGDRESLRRQLEVQRQEIDHLRLELARKSGYAEALQAQIDVQSSWDEDLRITVEDLQAQLVERDQELEALRAEIEWRRSAEVALREEVEWRRNVETDLQEHVTQLRASRTWRWWAAYQNLKRRLVRGSTQ